MRPASRRANSAGRVGAVGFDLLDEFRMTQQRCFVCRHHHRRCEHKRAVGVLGDEIAVMLRVAEASERDSSSSI